MSGPAHRPVAEVTVTAPVRITDVGGWTDTWFAGTGAVCHLGVGPGVTVRAVLHDGPPPRRPVRVIAADLGEDFRCGPSDPAGWVDPEPGRHPLLEHAVAAVCHRFPPPGPVTVAITSAVPPGASLGTSASVVVATLAALEHLLDRTAAATDGAGLSAADRRRLATAAHRVETGAAGREAGVQDQWAAAFGAAEFVEITDYPHARQTTIELEDDLRSALDDRLVTVVLGRHDSSAVHAAVIAALTAPERPPGCAPGGHGETSEPRRAALTELSALAAEARDALATGDFTAWAAILTESTRSQERLHPGLVGRDHRALIELGRSHDAVGWKVNGAGGDGGSLTVAFASGAAARGFTDAAATAHPTAFVPRFRLQAGVAVRAGT